MADKSTPSPPQSKRTKADSELKLDFAFGGKQATLTTDAQVSKEGIQASQLTQQPVNIWYGGSRSAEEEETDAASAYDRVAHDVSGEAPTGVVPPTGRGTVVAVLDSGINAQHSAFGTSKKPTEKIVAQSQSFVGGDITDRLGHGTQCAGLVCGSQDVILIHESNGRVPFQGVAPDARVMVCKVVRDEVEKPVAETKAACDAIDYILHFNQTCSEEEMVDIISMSFGSASFDSCLAEKIQKAISEGIVVVCAASNNGRNGHQPIAYPARLGHVLCIGACTAGGKPTDFCPVGRELDFLAQGEKVWAPSVGGSSAYDILDGTSFAAPLVAGIVCQLLEDTKRLSERVASELAQVQLDPPLWRRLHNVWCVRELLKEMAAVKGKHSDGSGYGKLDPMEYFSKADNEKLRIISRILQL